MADREHWCCTVYSTGVQVQGTLVTTWCPRGRVAPASCWHPDYQRQHGRPVPRARLQSYRTRPRLLTSLSEMKLQLNVRSFSWISRSLKVFVGWSLTLSGGCDSFLTAFWQLTLSGGWTLARCPAPALAPPGPGRRAGSPFAPSRRRASGVSGIWDEENIIGVDVREIKYLYRSYFCFIFQSMAAMSSNARKHLREFIIITWQWILMVAGIC